MAIQGMEREGMAWNCKGRHGMTWHDMERKGMA